MKKRKSFADIFLYGLGGFFVFLGVFSILYSVYKEKPEQVIWLCYISLILIGAGFLFKKRVFIISQLNVLIFPVLAWNMDFWHLVLTGESLWRITDYFFFEGREIVANIITLQHVYTIPLCIFGLWLMGFKKDKGKGWNISIVISVIQMSVLFLISRLFTNSAGNINCVFRSCVPLSFGPVSYWAVWFVVMILLVLGTNFILRNAWRKF